VNITISKSDIMKTRRLPKSVLYFLLVILLTSLSFETSAQVPEAINYQAVVRDVNGNTLDNTFVSFRISILAGSEDGFLVYEEMHSLTTNEFGLANLEIGHGYPISGDFYSIIWGADYHFVRIELDPLGGEEFELMGVMQLLSVPYALHAKTVENDMVDDADADPYNELQTITLEGNLLSLSGEGGTVTLPTGGGEGGLWNQVGVNINYRGGNVGIGTSTPAAPLVIHKDDQPFMLFQDGGTGNSTSNGLYIGLYGAQPTTAGIFNFQDSDMVFGTNGTSRMTIKNDGKIGIGTSSPAFELDIFKSSGFATANLKTLEGSSSILLDKGDVTKDSKMVFKTGGTMDWALGTYGGNAFSISEDPNWADGTFQILKASGNIGIGETTPQTKLHVDGGTEASVSNANSGFVTIGSSTSNNIVIDNNEIMARNGSQASTLYLQEEGGDVVIGGDLKWAPKQHNQYVGPPHFVDCRRAVIYNFSEPNTHFDEDGIDRYEINTSPMIITDRYVYKEEGINKKRCVELKAPLNLPDGAKVKSLTVVAEFEGAQQHAGFALGRYNIRTGTQDIFAYIYMIMDDGVSVREESENIAGGLIIDNSKYAYYVIARLQTAPITYLYGADVSYETSGL